MPNTRITTVPTWSAATSRLPDPVRIAAFALAALALEVLLARSLVAPQIPRVVLLFVGILGIAFVFRFPMATALLFVGLIDFIFHPTFFGLEVGPLSVRPHELALGALLVVAMVRPERRTWGGAPGVALAVFLAIVAVSGAFALADGRASLTDVFNWSRPLGLLTFFYAIVRLFPSPRQRRVLLTGAAVLAAAAGAVALTIALGAGFGDFLQGAGGNTIRSQEGLGSIDRVRLAGLSAGYALFWYVVVQLVAARGVGRLGWTLLLAGIATNIVVSFNRNMWVGLAIGLVMMAILGGSLVRNRLLAAVAVAATGMVLIVAFGNSRTDSALIEPVVERAATILNPSEVSSEGSFRDRARESGIAWGTAKQNPVLGVGPGADFNLFTTNQVGPHSFLRTPQLFLHNQYLYLLLIAGIPGLVAFLVFLGAPMAQAFRRLPRDPAIAACGVGIALIMISAVVAIYFTVEDMTAVLGMLAGIIVADGEGRAAAGRGSGLTA